MVTFKIVTEMNSRQQISKKHSLLFYKQLQTCRKPLATLSEVLIRLPKVSGFKCVYIVDWKPTRVAFTQEP